MGSRTERIKELRKEIQNLLFLREEHQVYDYGMITLPSKKLASGLLEEYQTFISIGVIDENDLIKISQINDKILQNIDVMIKQKQTLIEELDRF